MKRSALEVPHVTKARFIGQSPASFFMHRKVRFIEKNTCRSKCFFLAPPAGLAQPKAAGGSFWQAVSPPCGRLARSGTGDNLY